MSDSTSLSPATSASSSTSWRALLHIAELSKPSSNEANAALKHAALTLHASLLDGVSFATHRVGDRTFSDCARGRDIVTFMVDGGFCSTREDALKALRELEWRGLLAHCTFSRTVHDGDLLYFLAPRSPNRTVHPFVAEDDLSRLAVLAHGAKGVVMMLMNEQRGIQRRTLAVNGCDVRDAFRGHEAVQYITERGIVRTQRAAVALGRLLQHDGAIEAASPGADFGDTGEVFRFASQAAAEVQRRVDEHRAAVNVAPAASADGASASVPRAASSTGVRERSPSSPAVSPRAETPPQLPSSPSPTPARRFPGIASARPRSSSVGVTVGSAARRLASAGNQALRRSSHDRPALPLSAPPARLSALKWVTAEPCKCIRAPPVRVLCMAH